MISYSLQPIAGPADEPISLAAAKLHLRVDGDAEDTLIAAQLSAAREYAETFTRRSIARSKWRMVMDREPGGVVMLPRPPLVSVDEIACITNEGPIIVPTEDYQVLTKPWPGVVMLAPGASWPELADVPGAFGIEFTAGYEEATLPAGIRAAILLLLGHLYTNRESVVTGTIATPIPMATDSLLWGYREF